MRRNVILSLAAAATIASSASARAECVVAFNRWFLGQDARYGLEVRSGEACLRTINLNNGGAAVGSLRIVERARHGVAGVSGRSTYAYRSAPGYAGPDSFVLEIAGERFGGGAAKTRITFDVTVTK